MSLTSALKGFFLTQSPLDTMRAFEKLHRGNPYNSSGSDNNSDGIPDRMGPWQWDCSGWCWGSFNSWHYEIPQTSADVARWGRELNYLVPLGQAKAGDLVIHDKFDDAYNSYGSRGHIGWVWADWTPNTLLTTCESASSQGGVGVYQRSLSFWCLAVRVPGVSEPAPPKPNPEVLMPEYGLLVDSGFHMGTKTFVNLDRFGGLHASPSKVFEGGGYWKGQDVARRIVFDDGHPQYVAGWVVDLFGYWHPFAEHGHPLPVKPGPSVGSWPGGHIVPMTKG